MSTPVRDHQKSQVYAAEQVLRAIYDNGVQTPVTLRGVTLQLEPEDRFTSLADVQIYLDRVISHPGVIEALGPHPRITVRERKGRQRRTTSTTPTRSPSTPPAGDGVCGSWWCCMRSRTHTPRVTGTVRRLPTPSSPWWASSSALRPR